MTLSRGPRLAVMTEQPANAPQPVEEDLPEQMRIRREKRERLLASGRAAYPVTVPRTHTLAEIRRQYDDQPLDPDTRTGDRVAVTGRVISTGYLADLVVAECRCFTDHAPWLTLRGLELVFARNS